MINSSTSLVSTWLPGWCAVEREAAALWVEGGLGRTSSKVVVVFIMFQRVLP